MLSILKRKKKLKRDLNITNSKNFRKHILPFHNENGFALIPTLCQQREKSA